MAERQAGVTAVITTLDEASVPSLRHVIGSLLAGAERADIAVSSVRLAAIDLSPAETDGVLTCRILLGRLDSRELESLGAHGARARAHLSVLRAFLCSGRVSVRSAGMAAWLPDFSLYVRRDHGVEHTTCILGAHYFRQPAITDGPSLTAVLEHEGTAVVLQRRFETLWDGAHDVLPAVVAAVDHALGHDA
jgi:hypothetical protein